MPDAVETYKSFAALSFAAFWAFVVISVWRLKLGKSTSISGHMAANRKLSLWFGVITTAITPFLLLFFLRWFAPTFQLGNLFNILITTLWVLYFIAGVVPDTAGTAHKIHVGAAWTASVLLLPTMLVMIRNDSFGSSARIFMATSLGIMLICAASMRKSKYNSDKFLLLQAGYFLCFDISIVVATYLR